MVSVRMFAICLLKREIHLSVSFKRTIIFFAARVYKP
ncbi:hypothetical protein AvCA_07610 [Azotobacter vinelandii CA]|uniref:Uncharacterized protein n=2 Tax=Azotobacter vinelandii TaxID=354 RepID=C1DLQ9_AZOVD|nr:hypothetical protein Avin_07610 [Azotobacter vinelandii DJ]AGK17197.1 hypothetical protein AvCA_07610 [Azotobacter vinelandii CA]AGK19500.1 hypothetical protein AvCA6_07610 [Azotobacter vinelandii CA6]